MSDPPISRGFRGRGRDGQSSRIPPGQHLVPDFPVLSAGPTPEADLTTWTFSLEDGSSPIGEWSWNEFEALGRSEVTVDIHCVTTWSKLDTNWRGVAIATHYEGEPLDPEHGGPARLLVPHLYFWKSAKWVRKLQFLDRDRRGFWEELGYHSYGDPWREQRYDGD
jgi:DMSO/TMAO reductase YedYZ molybdopterin-dependent catalytic subunit